MKFEGIRTNTEGLIKLVNFLDSKENQKDMGNRILPTYAIKKMETHIHFQPTQDFIQYLLDVDVVQIEGGKEYTDKIIEVIQEISLN